MKINIIDVQEEINVTRAEYEQARREYDSMVMVMVDPSSFEAWLARRQERKEMEKQK